MKSILYVTEASSVGQWYTMKSTFSCNMKNMIRHWLRQRTINKLQLIYSTPKASSRDEDCPSLIYSYMALSLANVELFPIHPIKPSTSWTWCLDNNGGWPFLNNIVYALIPCKTHGITYSKTPEKKLEEEDKRNFSHYLIQ